MKRREFIERGGLACLASVGLTAFLSACANHKVLATHGTNTEGIWLKRSEFEYEKKKKTYKHPYVLLKPTGFIFPIVLYQVGEDDFRALLLQCTHQGCELEPNENILICPCHGAEFNTKGEVTQGPAEANLRTFPVSLANDTIFIQLT